MSVPGSPSTRELQIELYAYNAGIIRARDQYRQLPTAAKAMDWCTKCCYPRAEKRCERCKALMGMRQLQGAA